MQTAVINIRVEPETKRKAQRVTKDLGLTLSGVIEGFLKHLIRSKTVFFSLKEEPTEYLLQALKESKKDIKEGRVVSFHSPDRELTYLDKIIKNEQRPDKN